MTITVDHVTLHGMLRTPLPRKNTAKTTETGGMGILRKKMHL